MIINHLILHTIDCWCDWQPLPSVGNKYTVVSYSRICGQKMCTNCHGMVVGQCYLQVDEDPTHVKLAVADVFFPEDTWICAMDNELKSISA